MTEKKKRRACSTIAERRATAERYNKQKNKDPYLTLAKFARENNICPNSLSNWRLRYEQGEYEENFEKQRVMKPKKSKQEVANSANPANFDIPKKDPTTVGMSQTKTHAVLQIAAGISFLFNEISKISKGIEELTDIFKTELMSTPKKEDD